MSYVTTTLIFLIKTIRPLLGPASCKFPISCTEFAITALSSLPFHKAVYATVKRVFYCNPFTKNLNE